MSLFLLLLACPPPKESAPPDSEPMVDADRDGYDFESDCNDGDSAIHPNAVELCNGVDDNCDGAVDEGVLLTFYADTDGDGYGDADQPTEACAATANLVGTDTDCDDQLAAVHPGAPELCNGIDDDCDGTVDMGATDATVLYPDADGDGYGDAGEPLFACATDGYVEPSAGVDCDDRAADIHPGATESCNGLDDDCDGATDEEGAIGERAWFQDDDGDGYGDPGRSILACDTPAGAVEDASDCDDDDARVYPGAPEFCNGEDDNCDGVVDDSAIDAAVWYADADGDRYGDPGQSQAACSQPAGYLAEATDCDDQEAAVHPGASETCNGVDDDCNGQVDDGAVDVSTWYTDADGDGYGDAGTPQQGCTQPAGTVSLAGDCDDNNSAQSPGAAESCNGVDDDCDGTIDEQVSGAVWYADADGDGYGNPAVVATDCVQPAGYVANSDDCDDSSAAAYIGGSEVCDGVDNDCDGAIDGADSDTTAVPAGIMSSSQTWTQAASPYCLEGDVQLAPGATLAMEPGVEVGGNGHALEIYGDLDVAGTSSDRVLLSDLRIMPGRSSTSLFTISIAYAWMQGGSVYAPTGHSIRGRLLLSDSVLEDVGSYIYLWYPEAPSTIERNIFIRSGGVSIGSQGIAVSVTNNVFYASTSGYAVENWAAYSGAAIQVQYNSFLDLGETTLVLPAGYSSASMVGTYNDWGTTDTTIIAAMVFDRSDDLSCAGYISVSPYLSARDANTPDPTGWIP